MHLVCNVVLCVVFNPSFVHNNTELVFSCSVFQSFAVRQYIRFLNYIFINSNKGLVSV